MEFSDRIMTPAEKEVIAGIIEKIMNLERTTVGISGSIDELQSSLLTMLDTAIIVTEIDESRFEERAS